MKLEPSRIHKIRDAFCTVDQDGDGCITTEELAAALQALGHSVTNEELQERFHRHTQQDDRIDFAGFFDIATQREAGTEPHENHEDDELWQTFRSFDGDGDGAISLEELHRMMTHLGEQTSKEEAERMFRDADRNGDGKIDYSEFTLILMDPCLA